MQPAYLLSILLLLTFTQNILAKDMYATTDDGIRVLLKDNSSWKFINSTNDLKNEEDPTKVDLKVTRLWSKGKTCRIGLILTNRKARFIRNLALELTAYIDDNIDYDTLIIGFYGIKPTKYQYREALYSGISCSQIQHILVHGADYCSVGESHIQYSTDKGECLRAINVEKSDLIKIHK